MPEPMPASWYEYLENKERRKQGIVPPSAPYRPIKVKVGKEWWRDTTPAPIGMDVPASRVLTIIAWTVWVTVTVAAVIVGAHETGIKGVAIALFAVAPIVGFFCFLCAIIPSIDMAGTNPVTVRPDARPGDPGYPDGYRRGPDLSQMKM